MTDETEIKQELLEYARAFEGDVLERICRAGRTLSAADGVAMVTDALEPLAASGEVAEVLAQAQAALGEGPALEVVERQQPVSNERLREQPPTGWPLLADRLRRLGIGSMLTLPLAIEGRRLGVLHLVWSASELQYQSIVSSLAEVATDALAYQGSGIEEGELDRLLDLAGPERESLHRAMSLIWHIRKCTPARALAILHERAFLARVPLPAYAALVDSGEVGIE